MGEKGENIDDIRSKTITEIKEKVKKNPGYLHPMNKERQEDMKRLKFANGNDFTHWMQQNRIMKNPTDIKREEMKKVVESAGCKTTTEYINKCAQKEGFKDSAEKLKEWRDENGIYIQRFFNEDCSIYTGICIGEDDIGRHILDMMFEEVNKKKNNNPGFEYVCNNPRQEFLDIYPQFKLERNKEYKIDIKTVHFLDEYWKYGIDYNNITDYFLLIALETVGDVFIYSWFIYKGEIIRGREFWRRVTIKIDKNHLYEFKKFDITYIKRDNK